jgi:hypothetical protein
VHGGASLLPDTAVLKKLADNKNTSTRTTPADFEFMILIPFPIEKCILACSFDSTAIPPDFLYFH